MSEAFTMSQASSPLLRDRQSVGTAYGWGVLVPMIVALRLVVFAVGVISVHTVHSISQIDPSNASGVPWMAFDAHFYRYILLHGYPAGPEVPYQVAYFPLFPIASRLLLPLFQMLGAGDMSAPYTLVTFSNICSIIGLCFAYAWARNLTNARTALICVVLLALYPGAVFFCAGFTEAPFMMFVAIALCLLQKQRLYAAAAVSAVGTACRPTAISLAVLVVLWTIYYSWNLPKSQLVLRVLLIGMISIAGAASYQGYIWHRYQRFDAFKASEDKWDLDKDPIQSAKNQKMLEGVDQVWTLPGADAKSVAAASTAAKPEPRRFSSEFFIDRLTRTSVWNRGIALALFAVLIAALSQTTAVPKLVLAVPLVIFVISYLPNWGLRASSIFRYESGSVPLFLVMAIWLSAPRRLPMLLAVGGLSLAVQLYYAFLFSRGLWIG
jgi:hypothetical protein